MASARSWPRPESTAIGGGRAGSGLVVAGGALVGYVASRTVGLPGLPAEPDAWFEPMGVASLACEGLFVVLFAVTQTKARRDGAVVPSGDPRRRTA